MFDPFSPEPRQLASPEEVSQALSSWRPSTTEYLGAMVREGFWATTTGQGAAWLQTKTAEDDGKKLSLQEWQESPWSRPGLAWDEGMTSGRARAIAEVKDENDYRRWVIDRRQPGIGETVLGFGAAVVGSIPAPENFIPIAGPAFRGAQALRLARAGIPVMEAATNRFGQVAGRALVVGVDAAGGTALASPLVAASRERYGDEITFADTMLDIALGAAAGAAIGGALGVAAKARGARAASTPLPDHKAQQGAADTLGKATVDVADGKPVSLGEMPSARETVEAMAEVSGRRVGDADVQPMRDLTADPARRSEALAEFYRTANSEVGQAVPKQRLRLGDVSPELADRIRAETGIDVSGYRRSVDVSEARHIAKRHGPASRASQAGGLPVTEADIARYFEVVESPDRIAHGRTDTGLDAIVHEKKIGDWYYAVEEVRAGKRTLALKTLYKERQPVEVLERVGGGQSEAAHGDKDAPRALRPRQSSAQPARAESSAALAELEPAFVEPDYTPAADAPAGPTRPLPKSPAEEHGLDPKTGDFDELADLKRLEAAGKLSAEEKAALAAAGEEVKKTAKTVDANDAAVNCTLGG